MAIHTLHLVQLQLKLVPYIGTLLNHTHDLFSKNLRINALSLPSAADASALVAIPP